MIYLVGIGVIICIVLLMILLRIGPGVFSVQSGAGKLSEVERSKLVSQWNEVQNLIKLGGPSQMQQGIIKADKLIDYVLKRFYPAEETLVARYRKAKEFFSDEKDYDHLWYAHKVRNEIVHNLDLDLPNAQALDVIYKFEKSLQILGVLEK